MCGVEVPRGAVACPECGEKIRRGPRSGVGPYFEPPHSGPGIAAFIVALLGWAALIGTFAFTGYLMQGQPGGQPPPNFEMTIGGAAIAGVGLLVLGAILGLVGVLLPQRKKVYAILGLVFSLLPLLSCGGFIAVIAIAAANAHR